MLSGLQLYQARLDISPTRLSQLWNLLSIDEKERADRLKKENLRRNFIAARGNLRLILARSLDCDPSAIQFAYSDRGKPYLKDASFHSQHSHSKGTGIYFNLAHSHDLAIYAVSQDREVGIDIELMNPKINFQGIANKYFAESEKAIIMELGDRHRDLALRAFYQIWTLKEAYAKATGQGIANLLNQIDVAPLLNLSNGNLQNNLLDNSQNSLQIEHWQLQLIGSPSSLLEINPNYAAALCLATA